MTTKAATTAKKKEPEVKAKVTKPVKTVKPEAAAVKKAEPKAKKAPVKKTEPVKKPVVKEVKPASVAKKPAQKKEKLADTPVMTSFPTCRVGDKNGYITLIKSNLANRGYKITDNSSIYGEELLQAVMAFQKDNGMKVANGVVGPMTWGFLQTSDVRKMQPKPEPVKNEPEPPKPAGNCRVLIEGLSRYQADLLVKLFNGHVECRML